MFFETVHAQIHREQILQVGLSPIFGRRKFDLVSTVHENDPEVGATRRMAHAYRFSAFRTREETQSLRVTAQDLDTPC
jgi:hypothetical protein